MFSASVQQILLVSALICTPAYIITGNGKKPEKKCEEQMGPKEKVRVCEHKNKKGCDVSSTTLLTGPNAGSKFVVKNCPPPKK